MLMYPDADIPVTQVSIQPRLSPEHHFQLGKILSPLRELGVLIVASGSATHNLREFGRYAIDASPHQWVAEFNDWLSKTIYQGDVEALLNYRQLAPFARKNHPIEEHLLPLFVALGAGDININNITELHNSYTYGVLSMAAYEQAVTELFAALDYWEQVLGKQRYLCGNFITLADWCMFTTLFRFDLAYHGLFKCNFKRLIDYPNLWNYCCDLYQQSGLEEVCNVSHVKELYYAGIPEINPNGIVPVGPDIEFNLYANSNKNLFKTPAMSA